MIFHNLTCLISTARIPQKGEMEMLCNAIVRDDRGNSKDYKDGM
jgi:hypothetical protein